MIIGSPYMLNIVAHSPSVLYGGVPIMYSSKAKNLGGIFDNQLSWSSHVNEHFESNEWCEVRFAETQKSYNHATGFVELEVNEEVKAYDSLRHLAYSDKAFAALTFCVLKQREALQTALRSLLDWGRGTDINYEGLSEKINEQFLNGEYYKVSSELLQLVCGHRADVIQMRRDGITNFLRDPLTKVAVRKIPPSCNHLFKAEALTSLLEKAGGVRKAFLPLNKQGLNTPASQAGPSKLAHHPPQGQVNRSVPPQGISHGCCASARISHANQPSQGCYHSRPSQGQRYYNNHSDGRPASNSYRGSFRPRGAARVIGLRIITRAVRNDMKLRPRVTHEEEN
ncbi:putative reverse transcriptase, partial [Operophtera brumata]